MANVFLGGAFIARVKRVSVSSRAGLEMPLDFGNEVVIFVNPPQPQNIFLINEV